MSQGRHVLFRELFGREPSAEELQKFDRMGSFMGMRDDDSMWYVIIVNEFYDDRLKSRLAEVDRVADNAAEKALIRIAETVGEKADMIAARKNSGFMWRSWGLMMSTLVLLCGITMNTGYVMGCGKYPFWLKPENGLHRVLGWFLNVPSGWIFLLGTGPFLFDSLVRNMKAIAARKRLGLAEGNPALFLRATGDLTALIFLFVVVLSI